VLICVHPCPKEVQSFEFGVKGEKALVSTLGILGILYLYYSTADSLNFGKQIYFGQRFSEISPNPPLEKGGEGGISGVAWL